ncbi:MAG TPA: hypothetical protein VFN56_05370 [Candidatus Saccharimonadales bacterium]|nr:hypothetical protein [Candidatus Saccharimonadales bacterium]
MEHILNQLKTRFPFLDYTASNGFYWSPKTRQIFYDTRRTDAKAVWSLLHETGHALLQHTSYRADYELIRLEVAAWQKAQELADDLRITIDEDHVQDCLDTYRDWLYKRSICPTCLTKCLQQDDYTHYRCHNCHTVWRVTPSRFCRAYRSTKNVQLQPMFHAELN